MNKEILMEREKTQKFIEDIEKSDRGEIDGLLLDEDFSYPNMEFLKKRISSSVYKLMFRYESGPSYIGPTSRKYIFELYQYKTIKSMLIFKEWKPSAWEGEPYGIDRFKENDPEQYKQALNWRKWATLGIVEDDEKVLALIKELPDTATLKEKTVYDGGMHNLEINMDNFKAKYDWMMLADESKDFEERIKKVIRMVKR